MSQERTTSLRILQTNKKKTLSPVIYLLIGFISGIILTTLFFFMLSTGTGSSSEYVEPTQVVEENTTVLPGAKQTTQVTEAAAPVQYESTESEEDSNFTQPGSNDLNKFFQRTPPPAAAPAQTAQHASPFANEPHVRAAQPAAPAKAPVAKSEAVPAKVVKPAAQPAKAAPVKEPEAEAPDATVQIKVTQKPFAVNELK
ncbi:hypothetical protein ACH8I4_05090 [Acinetobacter sp. ABJ_C3_5]|jgi:hypothetical protein|uniref:hypothetical protein n=1 Tax=Acinetobacter TaxID=469 RepID=UPI00029DE8F1|nr:MULTISPECIES: hypothetical protein [Acinetobacter]EKU52481.1 hypothetical protein ACINWC323_2364 [Acinetobacter sp. WC-323]MBJ9956976.1 hypothetical protein [Acinetobacter courvalinii]